MKEHTLDLVLKGCWYDLIKSGVKREEYREIKPYWCNRLLSTFPLGNKYWTCTLDTTFRFVGKYKNKGIRADVLEHLLVWNYGSRNYRYIRFRRGYTKESMLFKIDSIEIGFGKSDLGAPQEEVFIIKFSEYERK